MRNIHGEAAALVFEALEKLKMARQVLVGCEDIDALLRMCDLAMLDLSNVQQSLLKRERNDLAESGAKP